GRDSGAACEFREVGDELLTGRALRDIASIKREVATVRQCRTDACQYACMAGQIGIVENSRAKLERAGAAVRHDLDAIEIGKMLGLENPRDLIEAVASAVNDEGLLARLQSVQQILDVRNAGVDEYDIVNNRAVGRHTRRANKRLNV